MVKIIKKQTYIRDNPEIATLPWLMPKATRAPIRTDIIEDGIVILGDMLKVYIDLRFYLKDIMQYVKQRKGSK